MDQTFGALFYNSFMYAKCNDNPRVKLWDGLFNIANVMAHPQIIGGDFNMVCNQEENI